MLTQRLVHGSMVLDGDWLNTPQSHMRQCFLGKGWQASFLLRLFWRVTFGQPSIRVCVKTADVLLPYRLLTPVKKPWFSVSADTGHSNQWPDDSNQWPSGGRLCIPLAIFLCTFLLLLIFSILENSRCRTSLAPADHKMRHKKFKCIYFEG